MKFSKSCVYQIYPKSFKDSNGDGFGDIRGIIEKLDYIKNLGADYIWSTPFFVSPMNDNGYDVANYLEINPQFGTMQDVEELIAEADKRGLGLMFDMVFNHTSTEHEWFQRALKGEEKYLNYYIFKDGADELGVKIRRQRLEICAAFEKMVSAFVRRDASRFELGKSGSARRVEKCFAVLEK